MKCRSDDRERGAVTILFVEDDADDILLLSRALSKSELPAKATFVHTPVQLHEYLSGTGKFSDRNLYPVPKVILTDNRLAEGSAADIIELVNGSEEFKNIPVLVLSSLVSPREKTAMLGAGARACFEKPIDIAGFCKVFQSAISFTAN